MPPPLTGWYNQNPEEPIRAMQEDATQDLTQIMGELGLAMTQKKMGALSPPVPTDTHLDQPDYDAWSQQLTELSGLTPRRGPEIPDPLSPLKAAWYSRVPGGPPPFVAPSKWTNGDPDKWTTAWLNRGMTDPEHLAVQAARQDPDMTPEQKGIFEKSLKSHARLLYAINEEPASPRADRIVTEDLITTWLSGKHYGRPDPTSALQLTAQAEILAEEVPTPVTSTTPAHLAEILAKLEGSGYINKLKFHEPTRADRSALSPTEESLYQEAGGDNLLAFTIRKRSWGTGRARMEALAKAPIDRDNPTPLISDPQATWLRKESFWSWKRSTWPVNIAPDILVDGDFRRLIPPALRPGEIPDLPAVSREDIPNQSSYGARELAVFSPFAGLLSATSEEERKLLAASQDAKDAVEATRWGLQFGRGLAKGLVTAAEGALEYAKWAYLPLTLMLTGEQELMKQQGADIQMNNRAVGRALSETAIALFGGRNTKNLIDAHKDLLARHEADGNSDLTALEYYQNVPTASVLDMVGRDLTEPEQHGLLVRSMANLLGLGSDDVRTFEAGFIGGLSDDIAAGVLLLGVGQGVVNRVRKYSDPNWKPPAVQPGKNSPFALSAYEAVLAEKDPTMISAWRARLTAYTQSKIEKIKDPQSARALLTRAHEELQAVAGADGIPNANFLAALNLAAERIAEVERAPAGRKLPPEARESLQQLVPHIAELPPLQADFVSTGSITKFSAWAEGKAIDRILAFYDKVEQGAANLVPGFITKALSQWNPLKQVSSILKVNRHLNDLLRRQQTIMQVAEEQLRLSNETSQVLSIEVSGLKDVHDGSISFANTAAQRALQRTQEADLNGGTRLSPAPALLTPMGQRILKAVQIGKNDPQGFLNLTRDEAARKFLIDAKVLDPKYTGISPHDLTTTIADFYVASRRWITENGQPVRENFGPRQGGPDLDMQASILQRFEDLKADGGKSLVRLSPSERAYLTQSDPMFKPGNWADLKNQLQAARKDLVTKTKALRDEHFFQENTKNLHQEAQDMHTGQRKYAPTLAPWQRPFYDTEMARLDAARADSKATKRQVAHIDRQISSLKSDPYGYLTRRKLLTAPTAEQLVAGHANTRENLLREIPQYERAVADPTQLSMRPAFERHLAGLRQKLADSTPLLDPMEALRKDEALATHSSFEDTFRSVLDEDARIQGELARARPADLLELEAERTTNAERLKSYPELDTRFKLGESLKDQIGHFERRIDDAAKYPDRFFADLENRLKDPASDWSKLHPDTQAALRPLVEDYFIRADGNQILFDRLLNKLLEQVYDEKQPLWRGGPGTPPLPSPPVKEVPFEIVNKGDENIPQVSKSYAKMLQDRMGSAGSKLLFEKGKGKGALDEESLSYLSPEERNGLQLYQDMREQLTNDLELLGRPAELLRKLKEEGLTDKQIRERVNDLYWSETSAVSMGIMAKENPRGLAYEMTRAYQRHQGVIGMVRYEMAQLARYLNKDYTPAQLQNLLMDLRDGKSSTPEAKSAWQRLQYKLLYTLYKVGGISAGALEHYIGKTGYYHGVFEAADAARLPGIQMRMPIPRRFRDLDVNPFEMSFRKPETSWWVAWENQNGSIGHVTGPKPGTLFQTAEEAASWLDDNKQFKSSTKVGVYAPWTFAAKEGAGLIVEAVSSMASLSEQMSHNIAALGLSKTISQLTGFVYTEAQMFDFAGGKPAHETLYEAPNGQRWHKVNDPQIPHLHGKWLNENVIDWLHSHHVTHGWVKAMAQSFQNETGVYNFRSHFKNPLISTVTAAWEAAVGRLPATGLFGRTLVTLGNILGTSKVLFNAPSHITQWISNILWNAPAMGVDPFDFIQGPKFWRYIAEGAKSYRKTPDPIWELLYGNANQVIQRSSSDALLEKTLDRNWRSTAGLDSRIARETAEFKKHTADPEGAEKAGLSAERLTKLHNERQIQEGKESKVSGIGKAIIHWTKAAGQLILGRGEIAEGAWDFFGVSDRLTKYAAAKYLINDDGMSQKGALSRVDAFGQNLDRAPEAVKLLSQKLGGSKFTTYPFNQFSTIKNAIRQRPKFVALQLAKLQAWNRTVMASSGQDPDEMIEAFSQSNGYGPSSAAIQNLFLMSRIMLPGGAWIDLDPVFGILVPQSPMARRVSDMIKKSGLDPVTTLILQGVTGAASKFAGGSLAMNAIGHIMSEKGVRGEPVRQIWDFIRTSYKELTPEWFPGGRDWEFMFNTLAVDPVTNKPTAGKDIWHYLKRFLKVYPADTLGSHVRAKAALDSVMLADGTSGKFYGNLSYWDLLEVKIRSQGGFNPDGSVNSAKALEIVQKHHKDLDRVLPGLDDDDPKEGQIINSDYILRAARQAVMPRIVRSYQHANLSQDIEAYVHWRAMDAKPDPDISRAITQLILHKASSRPSVEMQIRLNRRVAYYATLKDRLPADVLPMVSFWIYKANQQTDENQ